MFLVACEGTEQNDIGRLFVDLQTLFDHLCGKLRLSKRQSVLHIDGGLVYVGALFESDGQVVASVGT